MVVCTLEFSITAESSDKVGTAESLEWTCTWVKARADATESDAGSQGLTLAHSKAQLEDLWDTLLTLELNLSTFGTHPRVVWVM